MTQVMTLHISIYLKCDKVYFSTQYMSALFIKFGQMYHEYDVLCKKVVCVLIYSAYICIY